MVFTVLHASVTYYFIHEFAYLLQGDIYCENT